MHTPLLFCVHSFKFICSVKQLKCQLNIEFEVFSFANPDSELSFQIFVSSLFFSAFKTSSFAVLNSVKKSCWEDEQRFQKNIKLPFKARICLLFFVGFQQNCRGKRRRIIVTCLRNERKKLFKTRNIYPNFLWKCHLSSIHKFIDYAFKNRSFTHFYTLSTVGCLLAMISSKVLMLSSKLFNLFLTIVCSRWTSTTLSRIVSKVT